MLRWSIATVSMGGTLEAKLRELGVDGRWFAKNQKVAKGYTTVKVVARKA